MYMVHKAEGAGFEPPSTGDAGGASQKAENTSGKEVSFALKMKIQMMIVEKLQDLKIAAPKRAGGDESVSLKEDSKKLNKEVAALEEYLAEYSLIFNALLDQPKIKDLALTDPQAAADAIFVRLKKLKPVFDEHFPRDVRPLVVDKPSAEDLRWLHFLTKETDSVDTAAFN